MTLRVLHVGKFYPPYSGGMEVFLASLIYEQRSQGVDAHALVHGTPMSDDPPWLHRVPVQFNLVYAPIAFGFRRALDQAIERLAPDVLHLHMPNNSALWALTLYSARKVPWVVHWHSDVVLSRIRASIALAYHLYRPFEQAVLARAERIISTSPPYLAASEPLSRWRNKCAVVPLGLDATELPSNQADDGYATRVWGENTLRLLAIGRLSYYKGFETLIEAVAGLEKVELLIVGDGELRDDLSTFIETVTPPDRLPNVRLLGGVDDSTKNALLRSCDVFCLASRERTEAFGVVLLEAMQYARPCIVSALPGSGMPWVIETAEAGLQASPEDAADWAAKIELMRNSPELRAQWGAAGRRGLAKYFSIAACAQSVSAEYAMVVPDVGSLAPPHKGTLIVIPARNEAATIGALLACLSAAGWNDVVVINDQSTDNTGQIAFAAGAHVLNPVLPIGAWGGMQAGIRYALRQGYEAVITMDADGQHEVAEIAVLLRARDQGDLIVGAFPERASKLRQLAWNWFRNLAGFDLRDLTSGFRLYNRDVLEVLASREATLLDYQDLGALLLVRRAGLRIREVPVSMNQRAAGQSRIFNSWFSVLKYMAATTLLCMAQWNIKVRRDHRSE